MGDEEGTLGEQGGEADDRGRTPEDEAAEESREQAGERSMRPDIQGGALRMADEGEPHEHRHPSYREAADEVDENEKTDGDGAA